MMKKLFLLICVLFPFTCFCQSIKIRHISTVSDKPIFTLIISNTPPLKKELDERYIDVDNNTLERLLCFIVNNKKTTVKMEAIEYSFGSFVIETQDKGDKKEYVLNNAQASIRYFKKLSVFLEKRNKGSLATEFNNIIARIE